MAKPGEKSWLTSDVLTKTLGQFTGDMTDAQLAAQGFNAEQIKTIQQTAKSAQNAATEVKTLPQVFDVARETIGSGWSQTFQNIFGNFNESKKTFTELSQTINGFINTNSDARNKVLKVWHDLGGRTVLIDGIKQAFQNLMAIIAPIKDAFRDIFPPKTGKDLFEMTKNFSELMDRLKPSQSTIDNLRRIFAGLFAVLDIGWNIIKAVGEVFFDLIGVVGKGSGGFLGFIAGIGDFLVAVDQAIAKGDLFKSIFQTIGTILAIPLKLLGAVGAAIANLFGGSNADAGSQFESTLDGANAKLKPLKTIIDKVVDGWNAMVDAVGRVKEALDPFISQIADKLSGVGDLLVDAFKSMDFNKVMSALQTGFIGGIFVVLKKAFGDGLPSIFGDSLEGVNGLLKGLTGNLEAMQKKVQAETLLAIGAAILVLAGGVYILSTIDGDKLSKAMLAVAVGLGELMGALKLMTSGAGKLGVLQLPFIAAGMIGLAIAVTILAGAMKIFSTMNWEDIGKGLVGVAGALAAVGLGMKLMPATMPLTAAGLILIGVALNIIAAAMVQFGIDEDGGCGQGRLRYGMEALAGIALGVSMMPPTLPLTAAGLILMEIGLAAIERGDEGNGQYGLHDHRQGCGADDRGHRRYRPGHDVHPADHRGFGCRSVHRRQRPGCSR
jgi:hypothetical protein